MYYVINVYDEYCHISFVIKNVCKLRVIFSIKKDIRKIGKFAWENNGSWCSQIYCLSCYQLPNRIPAPASTALLAQE